MNTGQVHKNLFFFQSSHQSDVSNPRSQCGASTEGSRITEGNTDSTLMRQKKDDRLLPYRSFRTRREAYRRRFPTLHTQQRPRTVLFRWGETVVHSSSTALNVLRQVCLLGLGITAVIVDNDIVFITELYAMTVQFGRRQHMTHSV